MVVERPERVQGRVSTAGKRGGGRCEPCFWAVGTQQADAFAALQATLVKHRYPAREGVLCLAVGQVQAVLAKGHAVWKAPQSGGDHVPHGGRVVQRGHDGSVGAPRSSWISRRSAGVEQGAE